MLTADSMTKDLGSVQLGLDYNFTYTLYNESPKTIEISKAVTGCTSCTKASIPNKVVQPGGETTLYITFTPGSIGQQKKNVYVHYNGEILKLDFTAISNG
jgi:Protein of unknown function (DUF1573)